jgi:hypothetical protein
LSQSWRGSKSSETGANRIDHSHGIEEIVAGVIATPGTPRNACACTCGTTATSIAASTTIVIPA